MLSTYSENDATSHASENKNPPISPFSYYFASQRRGRTIDVESAGMRYASSVSSSSNSSGHGSNTSDEVLENIPNGVYNGEFYSRPVNVSLESYQ